MAQKALKKTVKMQWKGAVGHPAEEIADEALEGKYDFIVMGFHGLRGLARLKAMGNKHDPRSHSAKLAQSHLQLKSGDDCFT